MANAGTVAREAMSVRAGASPADLRGQALTALMRCVPNDGGCFYLLARGPSGNVAFRAALFDGVEPSAVAAFVAQPDVHACLRPIQDASLAEQSAFFTPTQVHGPGYTQCALYRDVLVPNGFHHTVRLIGFDDGAHTGWVGLRRLTREFTSRDRRTLAPMARVCSALLRRAFVEEEAERDRLLGDVVFTASGAVLWASARGQTLMMTPFADALRAWVVAHHAGRDVPPPLAPLVPKILRLEDGSRHVAYLVSFEPLRALRASPLAALTRMQCAVVEEVAAGRSVHEAARALGRGEETVRTHLKSAYARLGVASRAELVTLLRGGGVEH